jgi:hypothetical protein
MAAAVLAAVGNIVGLVAVRRIYGHETFVFGAVWLSQIVPDLLSGRASTSASSVLLPTNPVHVLDLALFLPAVVTSGVMLLRGRPFGYVTAPDCCSISPSPACPFWSPPPWPSSVGTNGVGPSSDRSASSCSWRWRS